MMHKIFKYAFYAVVVISYCCIIAAYMNLSEKYQDMEKAKIYLDTAIYSAFVYVILGILAWITVPKNIES